MKADRRISLHKLEVFLLVVELGGVSRAAERLLVSQPVVSAHLRSLEEALGCRLLEQRSGRRALTEPGRAVHRWAREALRATYALEREIPGQESALRPLRIAASMSLGSYRLARAVARVLVKHPGLEVEGRVSDFARAVEEARAGMIDFALVLGAVEGDHEGLAVEVVDREELLLLVAPTALDGRGSISLAELAQTSLLAGHGGDGDDLAVRRALTAAGVEPRIVMELGHPEAVKAVLQNGVTAAFLPQSAAATELVSGKLRRVKVEGLTLELPVVLVHLAERELSKIELELVAALRIDRLLGDEDLVLAAVGGGASHQRRRW